MYSWRRKNIGDGLYLSTGSQIVGNVKIGDNVTVATHSLVLSDCVANTLVAGSPSIVKKKIANLGIGEMANCILKEWKL